MKIKVIGNSFGVMKHPLVRKYMEKPENEWRLDEEFIKLIEKKQNEIKYLANLIDENQATESQKSKFKKLTDSLNDQSWLYFKIIEVDTSKPWFFGEYDSAVFVNYIEVENKDLNLHKICYS